MRRILATAILLATAAGACSTPAARGPLGQLRAHDRAMHAWCPGGYAALEVHGTGGTEIVGHCPGQEAPVRNR